ncbi:HEPN AbiU2-like domain-containing protein [Vibrio crassostreae]|jgi:hypothetical protein|nr:HEPN AbiU2-like domain-containing protein [Vibrio crassostreae]CAK2213324.1 HEPN AbiU2-like domain-containing protein [Vibrio crassostreae]CAK2223162.1 HEPN AbiU2-like domain-containing protein [Vibrio crassostreae]CAK2903693.1 HEPN AbiU2-like domain-containing protein [Vibrio crassostreae]CAK2935722.1 HEPN AbiU2-like domain-containing protein [Vibrio crassostreae]
MKKLALLVLGASLSSSMVFADSELTGRETLSLTHQDILEIYKDNRVVYDQNNMPYGYDGEITAIYMTINKLRSRLSIIRGEINQDYLYSGRHEEKSRTELVKLVDGLVRVTNQLNKLREGFIEKPSLIDKHYALSVNAVSYTNRAMKKTNKMIGVGDIRSGYANELNLVSSILNDIADGYRNKSLKLILSRGDITGDVETPYADVLNFNF